MVEGGCGRAYGGGSVKKGCSKCAFYMFVYSAKSAYLLTPPSSEKALVLVGCFERTVEVFVRQKKKELSLIWWQPSPGDSHFLL